MSEFFLDIVHPRISINEIVGELCPEEKNLLKEEIRHEGSFS
jgi:hypothetical protein